MSVEFLVDVVTLPDTKVESVYNGRHNEHISPFVRRQVLWVSELTPLCRCVQFHTLLSLEMAGSTKKS